VAVFFAFGRSGRQITGFFRRLFEDKPALWVIFRVRDRLAFPLRKGRNSPKTVSFPSLFLPLACPLDREERMPMKQE
jgi:hypothetical protein